MRTIIIGCGRMGSGIAAALSMRGHTVAVIDCNPAAFQHLGPSFKGIALTGHAFDCDVLERAGIERADSLAAVTGNDEVNAVAARAARQNYHVPKVVARLYDPAKAEIYRRLGITTIAPVTWGIGRVCESLLYPRLNVLLSLGNGQVEIVEIDVPPALAGRRVSDLAVAGELQVISILRGGKMILPNAGMLLQERDVAQVAVSAAAVEQLNRLLGA
jgi:trk system potassium uptake protein TrkA